MLYASLTLGTYCSYTVSAGYYSRQNVANSLIISATLTCATPNQDTSMIDPPILRVDISKTMMGRYDHRLKPHTQGANVGRIFTQEAHNEWLLFWKSKWEHTFERNKRADGCISIRYEMLSSEKALISREVNRAWDAYLGITSVDHGNEPAMEVEYLGAPQSQVQQSPFQAGKSTRFAAQDTALEMGHIHELLLKELQKQDHQSDQHSGETLRFANQDTDLEMGHIHGLLVKEKLTHGDREWKTHQDHKERIAEIGCKGVKAVAGMFGKACL